MSVVFVCDITQGKCTICGAGFVYLRSAKYVLTCSKDCKRLRRNMVERAWKPGHLKRAKARHERKRMLGDAVARG